ncbi:hypothetical protein HDV00_008007 [Rhizophlyctis rosea]|nr:hypothetical protein HDV00_008007 [Rhizophlyctis rosea]
MVADSATGVSWKVNVHDAKELQKARDGLEEIVGAYVYRYSFRPELVNYLFGPDRENLVKKVAMTSHQVDVVAQMDFQKKQAVLMVEPGDEGRRNMDAMLTRLKGFEDTKMEEVQNKGMLPDGEELPSYGDATSVATSEATSFTAVQRFEEEVEFDPEIVYKDGPSYQAFVNKLKATSQDDVEVDFIPDKPSVKVTGVDKKAFNGVKAMVRHYYETYSAFIMKRKKLKSETSEKTPSIPNKPAITPAAWGFKQETLEQLAKSDPDRIMKVVKDVSAHHGVELKLDGKDVAIFSSNGADIKAVRDSLARFESNVLESSAKSNLAAAPSPTPAAPAIEISSPVVAPTPTKVDDTKPVAPVAPAASAIDDTKSIASIAPTASSSDDTKPNVPPKIRSAKGKDKAALEGKTACRWLFDGVASKVLQDEVVEKEMVQYVNDAASQYGARLIYSRQYKGLLIVVESAENWIPLVERVESFQDRKLRPAPEPLSASLVANIKADAVKVAMNKIEEPIISELAPAVEANISAENGIGIKKYEVPEPIPEVEEAMVRPTDAAKKTTQGAKPMAHESADIDIELDLTKDENHALPLEQHQDSTIELDAHGPADIDIELDLTKNLIIPPRQQEDPAPEQQQEPTIELDMPEHCDDAFHEVVARVSGHPSMANSCGIIPYSKPFARSSIRAKQRPAYRPPAGPDTPSPQATYYGGGWPGGPSAQPFWPGAVPFGWPGSPSPWGARPMGPPSSTDAPAPPGFTHPFVMPHAAAAMGQPPCNPPTTVGPPGLAPPPKRED